MFQISFCNQFYPIILPQAQLLAFSLNADQYQSHSAYRSHNKKKVKTAKKAVTSSEQNQEQRQTLKDGLEKSLDSTNKGFEILKKMGYEEGTPLGKCGSGMVEPLAITLRNKPNDRAGFGREVKVISKPPGEEAAHEEDKKNKASTQAVSLQPNAACTKREKRMLQLQLEHRKDIELLRLRLESEGSLENSLIVAIIAITGERICNEIFEIIQQYLVNSLHMYTGSPFPMFHDIAHMDDQIKVVCEDASSFNYLSDCLNALSANLSMPMTTTRIAPCDGHLYWFLVQMPGLVSGPQTFLSQLKKHRFGLQPDRWIIVNQQPCPKSNKTNLHIIIDEHSAMLLIFKHHLRLLVCMQEIGFSLRGKFPIKE